MSPLEALSDRFRCWALAYPETYEESPWGDRVVKVKGKIFLFYGLYNGKCMFTVKLPNSYLEALEVPGSAPTGYGLGKARWVSLSFDRPDVVPEETLRRWLDESYRAVAPRTLVKKLGGEPSAAAAKETPRPKRRKADVAAAPEPPRTRARSSSGAKGTVVLVGGDNLRLERASRTLDKRGFKVTESWGLENDVFEHLLSHPPDVVVLDAGRRGPWVLELAADLMRAGRRVLVAGVSGTEGERRARALGLLPEMVSRMPPGDETFVEQMVAFMQAHPEPPPRRRAHRSNS